MQIHFVDSIPKSSEILDGHLYISTKYNMTSHRCASGCGQLVPLPLSPADWSFTYDGETVSLSPSVGNGVLACNSHYFIRKSQIIWSNGLSRTQTLRQLDLDTKIQKRQLGARKHEVVMHSDSRNTLEWLRNIFKFNRK